MTPPEHTRQQQLYFWGRPLSPMYSCLMANRSSLYRRGFFKQHELAAPVISVGNLVLGGTGKTPLVHYIAKFFQQRGKRPAILSRGYKGSASDPVNVVSDGVNLLLDAGQAGDEPRLLAEKLPGLVVLTGKKRPVTGKYAIETCGADLLILDDGFQHLSLKRDLNLVLFSSHKLLGNGRVLPGGDLREPLSALQRADAFVISGVDTPVQNKVKDFIRHLGQLCPGKPIFTGAYMLEESVNRIHAGENNTLKLQDVRTLPVFGFCGIAQPESFRNMLLQTGMNLTGFQPFADHHAYSAHDIRQLQQKGLSVGAEALITTEKDLVKVRAILPPDLPLLSLPLRFRMGSDFDEYLLNKLGVS